MLATQTPTRCSQPLFDCTRLLQQEASINLSHRLDKRKATEMEGVWKQGGQQGEIDLLEKIRYGVQGRHSDLRRSSAL